MEKKRVYNETGKTLSNKEISLTLLKKSVSWLQNVTPSCCNAAYQKFFLEKKGFPRFTAQ
ncbi:hypothetical protein PP175_23725 [Aneurinibacillus sp. Ricciae_BoGa-3]|uniref:hypothetical protein n=1 Tax=Aneurinibacillus sp. Ricciae_BoGa-3 TaxID=3022697 RepID=UPI0023414188|nr:hypothetical protein [Aneurinibacillus sp. Ricciae_BoGa-3]WCK54262.1 hypothetical protein PP175_23725 [Aneurinibacillus sp. Ricciae_BoGa-3]